MEVYVAFSIAGSKCFITAKKHVMVIEELGSDFTENARRCPPYMKEVATKLHYSKLNTKSGEPTRSPIAAVKVFKDLEDQGWQVFKENFIKTHWKKH